MDSRMNAWTWGLLVLLGLIWGGSFFFARIAVQHVPPLTLVFFRLLLAALALHIYIAGRFDFYSILWRRWREFLILGLINNALPHALIFFGQTRIGAGLAAILNATTPIWTVLIANYFTSDEKLSAAKIGGCLVGLAGTIVLIGPGISAGGEAPLWALLLPVLAAISYGFAATYGKRFRNVPAPVTAAGQLTASSLIALPLSLLSDRPWKLAAPSLDVLLAILALALLSTAFGYILYFRIMAAAGATNASLVTLLVPPSAILLGALFLGERLALGEFIGMALIGFGLVILDGRIYRLLSRTT
ncbi:drug/metabolite transporter (DMT)-like permease [Rhizobium leguminosarum]|uniref:Drug/metabolite transporter (DMT)-like permease n=1 Tax=Rhizobium leguminosarum TaxID=384 RepID=A0AAE2MLD5_RHILE|nr:MULTISPECIES: DMT family transporter [Rhizobium]MBB4291337.1 drug/metabolite transporter (DMT)-like permease [Rhizobium leguminosarum]MBB4297568.1 drug/metabolite transporter (DMT)-like permease [Rhizobium leguminosarum]MBB4308708.1 drug/metabolite transporter (DMT)-like permease [Rhizobium leguminosarum]MBB4416543.1 drug/metabolite transporter (DMT)-like permease [Rhizobium leguminosarum]MBB4430489.1 drug/metabolite transporter (DMT)-like permease [Rhizobium esperanzae]